VEEITSMEARKGPTQGVQPKENATPAISEPKTPSGFFLKCILFSLCRKVKGKIPERKRAKIITIVPAIRERTVSRERKNLPKAVADAPKRINTIEKPSTNRNEFRKIFLNSLRVCFLSWSILIPVRKEK